jgi:hypothetical protein
MERMKCGGYQQSTADATKRRPVSSPSFGETHTASQPGRVVTRSSGLTGRYSNLPVTGGNVGDGVIIGR